MSQNPLHGERPEFRHLLAHQALPQSSRMLRVPRRARVTAQTYGGDTITIEADVIARSGEWLCVAQPDGDDTWNAWIHKTCCVPL